VRNTNHVLIDTKWVAASPDRKEKMMPEEWMTSKRRFIGGLMGGRFDRIPVCNPTSVATVESQELTGAYFPEAHTDAKKAATLAAAGYELLGYDTIMPYFSVHIGSPALGCEMDWGDRQTMPSTVTSPYKDDKDIEVPTEEERYEVYSIKAVVDAIKILREKYPDVGIIGKVMGPWTLGYNGFGVQNFLLQTIKNSEMVKTSLEKLAEISVMFANLQIKAGADAICFPDQATGDLVSPEMYHEFLTNLHSRITPRIGAPLILHICGNTVKRAQWFHQEGFDAFHWDTKSDLPSLRRSIGNKVTLVGGVSNINSLLQGTPEDVKREARCSIENGNELLAPECAIPIQTPNANLKAIAEVAKEIDPRTVYGREEING